jgi:hypothetical protein
MIAVREGDRCDDVLRRGVLHLRDAERPHAKGPGADRVPVRGGAVPVADRGIACGDLAETCGRVHRGGVHVRDHRGQFPHRGRLDRKDPGRGKNLRVARPGRGHHRALGRRAGPVRTVGRFSRNRKSVRAARRMIPAGDGPHRDKAAAGVVRGVARRSAYLTAFLIALGGLPSARFPRAELCPLQG